MPSISPAGRRPARLTYGFGRVKTLVAYTNGIAIFAIALWIVYEAWGRLMTPAPVLGGPMLVVAVIGLAVNIASFFVLHGGDRDSLNMRGAILHVLGDLLGSAAAIVAALVILATGWTPIDPILSVLVSVLILSTAWSLMREAAHVLLEGVPASLDRDLIAKDIAGTVKGVREVHHMHVWSLDGSSNMATLHACLNDGVDAHQAVSAIKKRLAAEHGIAHATVEPEFGQCADSHDEHDHDHDHDHDALRIMAIITDREFHGIGIQVDELAATGRRDGSRHPKRADCRSLDHAAVRHRGLLSADRDAGRRQCLDRSRRHCRHRFRAGILSGVLVAGPQPEQGK